MPNRTLHINPDNRNPRTRTRQSKRTQRAEPASNDRYTQRLSDTQIRRLTSGWLGFRALVTTPEHLRTLAAKTLTEVLQAQLTQAFQLPLCYPAPNKSRPRCESIYTLLHTAAATALRSGSELHEYLTIEPIKRTQHAVMTQLDLDEDTVSRTINGAISCGYLNVHTTVSMTEPAEFWLSNAFFKHTGATNPLVTYKALTAEFLTLYTTDTAQMTPDLSDTRTQRFQILRQQLAEILARCKP